jgi:hypothetical protein
MLLGTLLEASLQMESGGLESFRYGSQSTGNLNFSIHFRFMSLLEIYKTKKFIKPVIWDYQNCDCEDYCLLGYESVWFSS